MHFSASHLFHRAELVDSGLPVILGEEEEEDEDEEWASPQDGCVVDSESPSTLTLALQRTRRT